MKNRATYKFILVQERAKENKIPIYLRIFVDRKKAELFTGFSVIAKDWNNSRSKSNNLINDGLNKLEEKLIKFINESNESKFEYTAKDIRDGLTAQKERKVLFTEYFDSHIQRFKLAGEIEDCTIHSYSNTLRHLESFLVKSGKDGKFCLSDFNYEFIKSFDLYLLQKELHRNTINKYHKRIKKILNEAIKEGRIYNSPYKDFQLKTEKSKRDFLTDEELKLMTEHSLGGNESLIKVRDIFIFSVYTALRFNDAQKAKVADLQKKNNGKWYLQAYQEKTSNPVTIPLLPEAKKIIEKYDNKERKITGRLLPTITNQKVNSYLKTIGELCKIEKNITHHMARHTFATTIALNNGMAMEGVGKWLGHTSLKSTQVYAKITQKLLDEEAEKLTLKINKK